MLTLFSNEDNQFHGELTTLLLKASSKQVVLVASNTTNPSGSPTLSDTGILIPVLMYGGVAVAVIIAITYYSQMQLKSINELIKTVKKQNK
ncbi:MAG: hypothetical protein F6K47_27860 [Symploca sp. SIO2E6]|nr:hypothetical protein [Symploca sp. SIO2E6]